MKVLITGGSGQLGAATARALVQAGHELSALLRDPSRPGQLSDLDIRRVQGDITQPDSLVAAMRGLESVVHTAGLVSYQKADAQRMQELNVLGTQHVLDAAAQAGVRRVVLTSSIAALGWLPEGQIGDEDSAWNWHADGIGYFESKLESERRVLGETRLEGLAVNPGITFGANDHNLGAARLILQVAQGGPPFSPAGATTVASLDDVALGHVLALERGQAGRRYVLGGHTPSFVELYAQIGALLGRPAPSRTLPEAALVALGWVDERLAPWQGRAPRITPILARISSRNRRYRSARAEIELGWQARPLREGLEACLSWMIGQGLVNTS